MDVLVPKLYSEYGKYINQYRSFPSILDGCKLVERRILHSLYEVARDHLIKSVKVVGHCLGNYHPHSDASVYGSLVGLVQNGLAIGQGNWGTNIGVDSNPPAAMRYTEVRASKEILDLAFEYIKNVPYEEIELESEPVFIPTKLPICLIGSTDYCTGMGFGYRTLVPTYTKQDLVKRLQWLLSKQTGKEPIIRPISNCTLLSPDSEFQKLLTTGEAKIDFQGKYKTEGRESIIVTSIPPSKTFSAILKKFEKEISVDRSIGWQDESKTETRVRFTIIKPRMIKMHEFLNRMQDALKGSMTFECNVCNTKGKVVTLSIDAMILNVYNIYKQVTEEVLKEESKTLQKNIDELELIRGIKPHLSDELKQHPDELELVISNIAKVVSVSNDIVKNIFDKYIIARLFRINTDTTKLLHEKVVIDANINNLENYIWKEKYSTIR